uniref:Peptidase S1 domain-containing protein n=1 Tax=Anopheles funestus TaxID=62324 RepID=A0A4Y0BU90_ANOFN
MVCLYCQFHSEIKADRLLLEGNLCCIGSRMKMSVNLGSLVVICFMVIVRGDWLFPDEVQFNISEKLNKNCGHTPYADRIKPEDGRIFENPWMVLFRHPEEQEWFCQGTLITDRRVLTTAICAEAIIVNETIIILGEYERTVGPDCETDNDCKVEPIIERLPHSVIIHPGFQNDTYENDIALVTLNRKINYSNNVMPVCLPLTPIIASMIHDPIVYNTLWTDENRVPKQIRMEYIPQDKCQSRMRDLLVLQEGQICAQYAKRMDVQISSGSGSPLMIENHDRMFQIGILSIGLPDPTNLPYVYVNISTHIKWIHDTLDDGFK